MSLVSWFSLAVLLATAALHAQILVGWRRLHSLRDVDPISSADAPRVSIVVAARNEARGIEPAIRSLLALDYPDLEIVAVDDRSSDGTGEILDRIRAEFAGLQVVHVDDLPAGWLGKNHALFRGASGASGAFILFTDADVVYERTALARAIARCESAGLDHLTLIPRLLTRSAFVAMGMINGFVGLLALERPWRASETGRTNLGVGAFNLVRTSAYRAAGGHEAIRMEVLDDVELGRLMAARGRRQELMLAQELLEIEMYRSAREMIGGLQKNVFTFLEYSAPLLLAATAVTFSFAVWPWIGLFATNGPAFALNALAAAIATGTHLHLAGRFGYPRSCVAWLPLMGFVSIALMWQIAIRTWITGGITWRGTFYRLAEVRAARREAGRGARWRARRSS
jgi:glycosyltransferase involved in cell wall biosynthesis